MTQYTQQHSTQLAANAAHLTADDLWLHYFSVGGNLDTVQLDAYLNGVYPLSAAERNVVALALNELIDDLPQRPKADFVSIPTPE